MSKYIFDLKNVDVLNSIRSPIIYQFNLARNMALLSDDPAVIRRFFREDCAKLMKDQWVNLEIQDKFLAHYEPGQAFAYFGICPMIVQGKVNLIASNGFGCKSKNTKIDKKLNHFKKEAHLEEKFADGVYLESGLGDFLYRLSYNPKISDKPIIDTVEPQNFEVNYRDKQIVSFVIKTRANDDSGVELREIHFRTPDGKIGITYRFWRDGRYVSVVDKALLKECSTHFDINCDLSDKILPFDDFMIVFKKNTNNSRLYGGERGVPDIQGLDSIEDALTETLSDLIDAIRKGGLKEYVNEQLIPQNSDGEDLKLNHFRKTIITTAGSANPANPESLWKVVQGDIRWEAYIKTIQNLMSVAINKAGLSPTTLGLTGLESINSSSESQEVREKTSIRTRKRCLIAWGTTLTELLNKYLQVLDYINGEEILDYSDLIKIHFNDYINPSVENKTEVLSSQVMGGLKSREHAIQDLNEEYDEEDAKNEVMEIQSEQGAPALQGHKIL